MSIELVCFLIAAVAGVVYWIARPAEPKELARITFFVFLLVAAMLFARVR